MTTAQRRAVDRQIAETMEAMRRLRSALAKVDYAPDDLWFACVGKLKRLGRDLERLKKRK